MARTEVRKALSRKARLHLGSNCEMECRICNISRYGAMLQIPYGANLPRLFQLDDGSGIRRPAEVVWRSNKTVGLRFTDRTTARQPAGFGRRGG